MTVRQVCGRRRRRWLLAAALCAAAVPAPASANELLGTVHVPLDRSVAFTPTLTAGSTYLIVASGTVTETEPGGLGFTSDALRFFICDTAFCGQPSHLVIRHEGDVGFPNFDALNPATQLPFDGVSHGYAETFTATQSGRLVTFLNPWFQPPGSSSFQGGFTLQVYAVSSSPGGGGPGGPALPQTSLDATALAKSWGKAVSAGVLPPGGTAVLDSPKIGAGQKELTIDVGLKNAVATVARRDGLTRVSCVRTFVREFFQLPKHKDYQEVLAGVTEEELLLRGTLFLIACLDAVREAELGGAKIGVASAAGCGTASDKLDVRFDEASNAVRTRVLGSARARRTAGLRFSCRRTRKGLSMRIRPRSRRGKLRRIVGPRLRVGVYRSRAATGNGNLRAVFRR